MVLFLWLLYPTANCSWDKFRDTPMLSEFDDSELDTWRADKERIDQTESFFERWYVATEMCYARTPLMGQSPWKGTLMVLLLIVGVLTKIAGDRWSQQRRSLMY